MSVAYKKSQRAGKSRSEWQRSQSQVSSHYTQTPYLT
jgi:hypothetical protein